MRLAAGSEITEWPTNNGVMFFFPEENTFKYEDNYCFEKKKDAVAAIKNARKRRCELFLPYDGVGICKITSKEIV